MHNKQRIIYHIGRDQKEVGRVSRKLTKIGDEMFHNKLDGIFFTDNKAVIQLSGSDSVGRNISNQLAIEKNNLFLTEAILMFQSVMRNKGVKIRRGIIYQNILIRNSSTIFTHALKQFLVPNQKPIFLPLKYVMTLCFCENMSKRISLDIIPDENFSFLRDPKFIVMDEQSIMNKNIKIPKNGFLLANILYDSIKEWGNLNENPLSHLVRISIDSPNGLDITNRILTSLQNIRPHLEYNNGSRIFLNPSVFSESRINLTNFSELYNYLQNFDRDFNFSFKFLNNVLWPKEDLFMKMIVNISMRNLRGGKRKNRR